MITKDMVTRIESTKTRIEGLSTVIDGKMTRLELLERIPPKAEDPFAGGLNSYFYKMQMSRQGMMAQQQAAMGDQARMQRYYAQQQGQQGQGLGSHLGDILGGAAAVLNRGTLWDND